MEASYTLSSGLRPCAALLTLCFLAGILTLPYVGSDPVHGQYCKAYFTATLKFINGFYCSNYCCGESTKKFCCNDERLAHDQKNAVPAMFTIDITKWNETFYIMIGCIIGILCMSAVVILGIVTFCCRYESPGSTVGTPSRRRSSIAVAIDDTVIGMRSLLRSSLSSLDQPPPVAITVTGPDGSPLTTTTTNRKSSMATPSSAGGRKNSTAHKVEFYIGCDDPKSGKSDGPLDFV